MNCQITRNPHNNRIEAVEAPNGKESKLYADALAQTLDPEKALTVWAVSYTDEFKRTLKPKLKLEGNSVENEGSEIKFQKEGKNVNLELIQTTNTLARGKGYARKLMSDFIESVDAQGLTVRLIVAPRDKSTSAAKLENFYKSFGFVFDSQFGFPSDFEMIRYPKKGKGKLDSNGEAKIENVLNYLEQKTTQEVDDITSEEIEVVEGMMLSFDTSDSTPILKELERIFKGGQFQPKELRASNMFSEVEKTRIAENVEYREKLLGLKRKLDKSGATYQNDKTYREEFLTFTGEVNSYGIDVLENPEMVEKEITQTVAGITNREEFDNAFNSIEYPSIVEEYNTNEDFADEMFDEYSILSKLDVFEIEDGQLKEKRHPNRMTEAENAMNLDDSNFGADIRFLSQVPLDLWQTEGQDIRAALKSIEQKGIKSAVDLSGLVDAYAIKSKEEIIGFLATLNNLENTPNQENFQMFLESYADFFEVENSQSQEVKLLSEEIRDKSLVQVEKPLSEYEMFDKHSMIKVAEGLYQKVEKLENSKIIAVFQKQAELNKRFYLPVSAYNNIDAFLNKSYTDINLGVKNFDVSTAKQLYMMKAYFGNPITFEAADNSLRFFQEVENFNGNFQDLALNFISRFQSNKLQEKSKATEKFNRVYSKFIVEDSGIALNTSDVVPLRRALKEVLTEKEYNDLRNYSVISKNESMKELFAEDLNNPYTMKTLENEMMFFQNNIEALPIYRGELENMNPGEIVTPITGSNFLRVGDQLYIHVEDVGSKSFFREIDTYQGNFNVIGEINQEIINKFGQEQIKPYLRTQLTNISTKNLYSKKELESIDENQFECE